MAVDNVGMDVPIKLGDSRSNGFRDIRGSDFVWNERTNIGEAYPSSAKRKAFRLKWNCAAPHYVNLPLSCF